MASSFWNGDFTFDGESSSNYNVCIVDVNDNSILKQSILNMDISIDKETTINGKGLYTETDRSNDNLIIQLTKTDGTKWSASDLININKWLFKENFCQFQTSDFQNDTLNIVYYLKAVSMKKYMSKDFYGYIEIEFMSYAPYGYIINSTVISGSGSVYNYSNLNKNYKPKLRISGSGAVSIKNTTLNTNSLNITMPSGEQITIDCEMCTVLNNSGVNRFDILKDYNFLELASGNNNISVTGDATVEIICEFPVII